MYSKHFCIKLRGRHPRWPKVAGASVPAAPAVPRSMHRQSGQIGGQEDAKTACIRQHYRIAWLYMFENVSEVKFSTFSELASCHPDCKVWHFRRDLVGAGPTWLVRIWCGFCGSGADLERCGADLERYGAEMARRGWRCGYRQRGTEPATRTINAMCRLPWRAIKNRYHDELFVCLCP